MHKIDDFSGSIKERVLRRRGKLNPFDSINCRRTAHIVVDMQTAFLTPLFSNVVTAREICPRLNKISTALRAAGGLVVYLLHTVTQESVEAWSNHYRYFSQTESLQEMLLNLAPGSAGHSLWQDMDVQPEDLKIAKTKYSAFVHGSSDLHETLSKRGIDTVIITGTVTNVCCESTARDASMMNYKVLFVSDATAAHNDEEHNASLASMTYIFADVRSTESVLQLISKGS